MDTPKIGFLFDLDGVLVDSESEYTKIWDKIDKLYPTGVPNFSSVIKGTTLPNILSRYFPDPETGKKVLDLCIELESKVTYNYKEGANALLEELKRRGLKSALVTSSNSTKMEHLYQDLPGIKDYFVRVIDDRDVTRSKPDPQGYLLGAKALGADPANCVVMEDSLQGMRAGRAAGCFVVGVAGTLPEETIREECDMLVHNMGEINVDNIIEILRNRR